MVTQIFTATKEKSTIKENGSTNSNDDTATKSADVHKINGDDSQEQKQLFSTEEHASQQHEQHHEELLENEPNQYKTTKEKMQNLRELSNLSKSAEHPRKRKSPPDEGVTSLKFTGENGDNLSKEISGNVAAQNVAMNIGESHACNESEPTASANTISTNNAIDENEKFTSFRRKRKQLPDEARAILNEWWSEHRDHPYPTKQEQNNLLQQTGLKQQQLMNWFNNTRRHKMAKKLKKSGKRGPLVAREDGHGDVSEGILVKTAAQNLAMNVGKSRAREIPEPSATSNKIIGNPAMTDNEGPTSEPSDTATTVAENLPAIVNELFTSRSRRGKQLPDEALTILKAWLTEHYANPYPTKQEQNIMLQQTGLNQQQLMNWFNSTRRKMAKKLKESAKQDQEIARDSGDNTAGDVSGVATTLSVDSKSTPGNGKVAHKATSSKPAKYQHTSQTKNKRSCYRGVSCRKGGKYCSFIMHERKSIYLGSYSLASEAAQEYDKSARSLKGSEWKVNFATRQEYDEARALELEELAEEERGGSPANDPNAQQQTKCKGIEVGTKPADRVDAGNLGFEEQLEKGTSDDFKSECSETQDNTKSKNKYSHYHGVSYYERTAKYVSCITYDEKQWFLGTYELASKAAWAYDESARSRKGLALKLNFATRQEYEDAMALELEELAKEERADSPQNIPTSHQDEVGLKHKQSTTDSLKNQGSDMRDTFESNAAESNHEETRVSPLVAQEYCDCTSMPCDNTPVEAIMGNEVQSVALNHQSIDIACGASNPHAGMSDDVPSTPESGTMGLPPAPTSTLKQQKTQSKKIYSDYIGVTYQGNKFKVCITHQKERYNLGSHILSADAAWEYDKSARLLKGNAWEFNFATRQEYENARAQELCQLGKKNDSPQVELQRKADLDNDGTLSLDVPNTACGKSKIETYGQELKRKLREMDERLTKKWEKWLDPSTYDGNSFNTPAASGHHLDELASATSADVVIHGRMNLIGNTKNDKKCDFPPRQEFVDAEIIVLEELTKEGMDKVHQNDPNLQSQNKESDACAATLTVLQNKGDDKAQSVSLSTDLADKHNDDAYAIPLISLENSNLDLQAQAESESGTEADEISHAEMEGLDDVRLEPEKQSEGSSRSYLENQATFTSNLLVTVDGKLNQPSLDTHLFGPSELAASHDMCGQDLHESLSQSSDADVRRETPTSVDSNTNNVRETGNIALELTEGNPEDDYAKVVDLCTLDDNSDGNDYIGPRAESVELSKAFGKRYSKMNTAPLLTSAPNTPMRTDLQEIYSRKIKKLELMELTRDQLEELKPPFPVGCLVWNISNFKHKSDNKGMSFKGNIENNRENLRLELRDVPTYNSFVRGVVASVWMDMSAKETVYEIMPKQGGTYKGVNDMKQSFFLPENNLSFATGCPVTISHSPSGEANEKTIMGQIVLGRYAQDKDSILYTVKIDLKNGYTQFEKNVPLARMSYRRDKEQLMIGITNINASEEVKTNYLAHSTIDSADNSRMTAHAQLHFEKKVRRDTLASIDTRSHEESASTLTTYDGATYKTAPRDMHLSNADKVTPSIASNINTTERKNKRPYYSSSYSSRDEQPASKFARASQGSTGNKEPVHAHCRVHFPNWLIYDSVSKDRLIYQLTKKSGRFNVPNLLGEIGQSANCVLSVQRDSKQYSCSYNLEHVYIKSKGGCDPKSDVRRAKECIEDFLIEYIHQDGSKGRLFYNLGRWCKYLHPRSELKCATNCSVKQRNPFSREKEEGWMNIVELPYERNASGRCYHGHFLINKEHGIKCRLRNELGCIIKLCGDEFNRVSVKYGEPYVWLWGDCSENVDKAEKIVREAIRYEMGRNCRLKVD